MPVDEAEWKNPYIRSQQLLEELRQTSGEPTQAETTATDQGASLGNLEDDNMAAANAANLAGMAFIPYYRHLMEILEINQDLKQTAKGIFKQMACAASGAAVGGVVMGPFGALVGGIVGSVYGYCVVETYDSMLTILRNLSDYQKKELVDKVQAIVGSSGIEALTTFIGQQVNREVLVNLVRQFASDSKTGG